MKSFTTFILFCGIVMPTLAFYEKTDVIELTSSNFDSLVIKSHEVWVVEFYATWCEQCEMLAPEYIKIAEALKGLVKFGAVDNDKHKALGAQYGVKSFPTIKIFGENKQSPIDYDKERTAKGIGAVALLTLTDLLKKAIQKLKSLN